MNKIGLGPIHGVTSFRRKNIWCLDLLNAYRKVWFSCKISSSRVMGTFKTTVMGKRRTPLSYCISLSTSLYMYICMYMRDDHKDTGHCKSCNRNIS